MHRGLALSFAAMCLATLTLTSDAEAGSDDCVSAPPAPTGGAYANCSGGNIPSGTTCALTCANGYTKTGDDPQCVLGAFSGTGLNDCVPATCAPFSGPV